MYTGTMVTMYTDCAHCQQVSGLCTTKILRKSPRRTALVFPRTLISEPGGLPFPDGVPAGGPWAGNESVYNLTVR